MATQLRRIQISLPDSLQEALSDLAEAQKVPVSKVIVGLLSEMEPQIRDIAKYARLIKDGQIKEAKRTLVHMIGNGMAELLAEQMELPIKKGSKK